MSTRKNDYRSHYHCVFSLKYHLVLVTKYRRKCFNKSILKRANEICDDLCQKWDCKLLEFGGEPDHIHLLIEMHPNVTPARFVGNLKTVTSRLLRKEFSDHFSKFYWKPVLWTRAYCLLTTGGAPLAVIKEYIQKQDSPLE